MLKRVFIIIISVLFMSFSLSLTLAQQQQQPPLLPLEVIYGTAKIDNVPLHKNSDAVVSVRMENLIVIVMDSYDVQTTIVNIIDQLENGETELLAQAFSDSYYCDQQSIVLLTGATVVGEPDGGADTQWTVRSGSDTFIVLKTQVKVWNGTSWENGVGLEVYQRYGLMSSYNFKTSLLSTDDYVLEIQNSPNNLYWPDQSSYLLRDPGKAVVGDPTMNTDKAFIYINDVLVTSPPMPLALSSVGFLKVDINAPSCHDWSLTLKPGWSWMSYGINKCYYYGSEPDQPNWVETVDVATLPQHFTSLAAWLNSVISPPAAWKMVIGKKGIMDSSTDPSFHSLTYLSPIECYQIKIDESYVAGATINLTCGQYYRPGIDEIPLKDGWNWIAYPTMTGYYDTTQPANVNLPNGATWAPVVPAPVGDHVFVDNIVNQYDVLFGQKGIYDPDFKEVNSLHYIAPGQGFKIKMKQGGLDLIYPSQ